MQQLQQALKTALSKVSDEDIELAKRLVIRPGTWQKGDSVSETDSYLIHTSQFSNGSITHGECGGHGDNLENSKLAMEQIKAANGNVFWQDHGAGIFDLDGNQVSANLKKFMRTPKSDTRVYMCSDDRALFETLPKEAFDGGHYGLGVAVLTHDCLEGACELIALAKQGFQTTTTVKDDKQATIQAGLLTLAVPHDKESTNDLMLMQSLINGPESAMGKANAGLESVVINDEVISLTEARGKGVLLFYLERQKDEPTIIKLLATPGVIAIGL